MEPTIIELKKRKNDFEMKIENYRRWVPLFFEALYTKILEVCKCSDDQLLKEVNRLKQFKKITIGIIVGEHQFCDEKQCIDDDEYVDFLLVVELDKKWYIDYALQIMLSPSKNVKIYAFTIDANIKDPGKIVESIIILLSFVFNEIRDKIDRYIHSY